MQIVHTNNKEFKCFLAPSDSIGRKKHDNEKIECRYCHRLTYDMVKHYNRYHRRKNSKEMETADSVTTKRNVQFSKEKNNEIKIHNNKIKYLIDFLTGGEIKKYSLNKEFLRTCYLNYYRKNNSCYGKLSSEYFVSLDDIKFLIDEIKKNYGRSFEWDSEHECLIEKEN